MTNRRIESPHLSDIEFAPAGSKKVKIPVIGGIIIGDDSDDSNNIRLHKASNSHLQVVVGNDTTPEGTYAPVNNFMFGNVPVGAIISWMGGYFNISEAYVNVLGSTIIEANNYLNDKGWFVCDGVGLNDTRSPIFDNIGRYLPNLTDNRFLMGSTSAGGKGGANVLTDHTHAHSLTAAGQGGGSHDHTYSLTAAGQGGGSHGHTYTLTAAGQTLGTSNVASGTQSANHSHSQSSHTHTQTGHMHDTYQASGGGVGLFSASSVTVASNSTWTQHNGVTDTKTPLIASTTPPALGNNDANHTHTTNITHTHAASSVSGTINSTVHTHDSSSVSGTINSTVHTHDSSSVSGTVGSGDVATSTENRPKYLSCLYIMRAF